MKNSKRMSTTPKVCLDLSTQTFKQVEFVIYNNQEESKKN